MARGRCAVHGPAAAGWLVVALCAAAGTYCLLRLRGAPGAGRGTAGGEALMGFGMAVMAVPATVFAPPHWVWLMYAAVFGVAALHALGPARRTSHHLHHLVGMLAMVYMSVAMALLPGAAHGAHHTGGASGAGAAGGTPLATGVLLIYYAGYVLWTGARLLPLQSVTAPEEAGGSGIAGTGRTAGGSAGTAAGTVTEMVTDVVTDAGVRRDGSEVALACRLSMGIAMLAMLLTL
ncbi:DUF5134 domain-containing protein [Streptomyces sp. NPDC050428]|uniref:DUF5134 domain-containing protein n=1 Tax=Streptomyces sp. NPDC050428 TaxID=3155757 RepID=UPI00343BB224